MSQVVISQVPIIDIFQEDLTSFRCRVPTGAVVLDDRKIAHPQAPGPGPALRAPARQQLLIDSDLTVSTLFVRVVRLLRPEILHKERPLVSTLKREGQHLRGEQARERTGFARQCGDPYRTSL